MARTVTKSIAKLEKLITLYDRYGRLDRNDDGSFSAARELIRAQNELLDCCIDCGMEPDACEFEFAARVTTQFLVSA